MTQKKRPELKKFTTGVGTFKYPKLRTPDHGTDEFPDPNGSYKVTLVVPEDSSVAKELIAKLTPEHDAAKANAMAEFEALKPAAKAKLEQKNITAPVMNPLFSREFDRETGEPTGNIEFKFKKRASGERKDGSRWEAPGPACYDAKLNLIPKGIEIWGGTKGAVNFEVSPYFIPGSGMGGLSFRLAGVQVIELVTRGAVQSAESMGFGVQEGTDTSEMEAPDEEDNISETGSDGAEAPAAADNDDF